MNRKIDKNKSPISRSNKILKMLLDVYQTTSAQTCLDVLKLGMLKEIPENSLLNESEWPEGTGMAEEPLKPCAEESL